MFKSKKLILILILAVSVGLIFTKDKERIHHQISAEVYPSKHKVVVVDKITIPERLINNTLKFLLVKDLKINSTSSDIKISVEDSKIIAKDFGMDLEDFSKASNISQVKYSVKFLSGGSGSAQMILKYSGKINYELKQSGGSYDRAFSQTPGIISTKGIYLGGASFWVPWFNDELITYDLSVSLPQEWDVVSHGVREKHTVKNKKRIVKWVSKNPTEEVFLIAAKFTEYKLNAGATEVMAFLRTPDENLANKYLETTAQYLEMYRTLIGTFPYQKFALVENFWETGYGMPSFTLLGSKVIRFPFILHSSYPHELLHNYWGNSVFVDFKTGNWCEGLTVYLADHLIKEQRGQGSEYRREKLQRFTDYVSESNDFPLAKFLSRNSASSEAVGYGKSMMVFEMLRDKIGDEAFVKGIQTFYRNNKFRFASFDDLRKSFEAGSKINLKKFFDQWVNKTGAPSLSLKGVNLKKSTKGFVLNFTVNQKQEGNVFDLEIPLTVTFSDKIEYLKIKMNQKDQTYQFDFKEKPQVLQLDPRFNVFRKLHYLEIQPSLSKIYGSEKIMVILPSQAKKSILDGYKRLSKQWANAKGKLITVKLDNEISKIPSDRDVWILGESNKFKTIIMQGITNYDAKISENTIRLQNTELEKSRHNFLISVRHPLNKKRIAGWLTLFDPASLDPLLRKMMHYGKYSFLAFQGLTVDNVAKGKWQAKKSPMLVNLDETKSKQVKIKLKKRAALAKLSPVFSSDRMMKHIQYLSSNELEGRGLGTEGINKAAEYIAEQFKKIGLKPGGDNGTYFQTFKTKIDKNGKTGNVKNVIGLIPGNKKGIEKESVVVSAHYDHLGSGWPDVKKGNSGKIHNGADDNASGVSVMLELAETLKKTLKPSRSVIFVAFTAEETGLKGSDYYVNNYSLYPAKKSVGNINLDTVGRLFDKKLMVLNSDSAREWKFIFMGASYVTGVNSEMVSQQITASDQKSFIKVGVPGVQIFSGPHTDYHSPGDDFDKIDENGLIKVAAFVREGILYLADTEKFMTFKGTKRKSTVKQKETKGSRKVSTGIMPDFNFKGEGVRAYSVKEGSKGSKAGLKAGDIIVKIDKYPVKNLKEYSDALKHFQPGNKISMVINRSGKTIKIKLTLEER